MDLPNDTVSFVKQAVTVWFTGLPCSGKSTLAAGLEARLERLGMRTCLLDGDVIRRTLSSDLGFSEADRLEHARRIAELAVEKNRHGITVVAALVSPYRHSRAAARAMIDDFVEVYLRCPLSVCEARDNKGMYRRARQGDLSGFTGVDSPYEASERPDVTVDTDKEDVGVCVERVLGYLVAIGYLLPENTV